MYNPRGMITLFLKEIWRFLKVSIQTILAPVVTSLLYMLVFASVMKEHPEIYSGVEYTEPLIITQDADVKALTVMPSGHTSSTIDINLDQQDIVTGVELEVSEGVDYSYYTGQFRSVNDFNELKPAGRGMMNKVGLPADLNEDVYGLVIRAYVFIEKAGIYRFYTYSDDGSVLKVRGQVVVNNDGPHAPKRASGEIALGQGWHPFELKYFQAGGGATLKLEYSGPDIEKQEIPADKLASYTSPMVMQSL